MKKSISLLAILAVGSAVAGERNPLTTIEPDIIPPAEKKTLTLSVQGGIMHTDAANASITSTFDVFKDLLGDAVPKKTNLQMVPSVLYGFTITAEKNLTEPGQRKHFHSVGLSVGYYTGSESNCFNSPTSLTSGVTIDSSSLTSTADVEVDMIPILLTYNLQYEATESLYFYAGVRGGVVIRNTDVSAKNSFLLNYVNDPIMGTLKGKAEERYDDSCTKVLPTLGFGIGMRAYMTEKLAVDLSYDFGWTFGDDCDDIIGSEGSVLPGTSESGRYYGTLKAGVSYSF